MNSEQQPEGESQLAGDPLDQDQPTEELRAAAIEAASRIDRTIGPVYAVVETPGRARPPDGSAELLSIELEDLIELAEKAPSRAAAVVVLDLPPDRPTRQRALEAARRLLVPEGLLIWAAASSSSSSVERSSRATCPLRDQLLAESGFSVRPHRKTPDNGRTPGQPILARKDSYRMRPYRAGDERAILELFRRSFHTGRTLEHWRWKYQSNPYGRERISEVIGPGDELVGHYCAYPVPWYWGAAGGGGRSLNCHQVGDTMTARQVRHVGRGNTALLARCARHFYATFCEGQVAMNYGFNTGNIQKFSIRFVGAHKIEDVAYRHRCGPPPRNSLARRFAGRLAGFRVERIDQPTEELDQLWERVKDLYGILVERSSRYLGWRYFEHPDRDYRFYVVRRRAEILGWCVFLEQEQLVWGDALFDPIGVGALPRILRLALAESSANEISGWFPERPAWWSRALDHLGFLKEPEPQSLGLVVVPFEDREMIEPLKNHLYYTRGDSDLF